MKGGSDRGASMVFIAICLVFLIGFAGLAVDVGALYVERTELQKGAEAAALAIATDCAHGTKPCDVPTATATAEEFIDANARDLAGALDSIDLDLAAQEVTVVDRTERADGGGIFLPFFAQVIGFEGTTVRAQAKARWGTLGSDDTLPLTISACDIGVTNPEGLLKEPPDEPIFEPPLPKTITVTLLDSEDPEDECDAYPGFDGDGDSSLPAGFGQLLPKDDDPCVAYTEAYTELNPDMWVFQDAGVDAPFGCLDIDEWYLIPVFVDWMFQTDPDCEAMDAPVAAGDCYGIGGYVRFRLDGYRFPGYVDGEPGCSPPDTCITGYLKNYTEWDGDLGASFNFGVVVVELIG